MASSEPSEAAAAAAQESAAAAVAPSQPGFVEAAPAEESPPSTEESPSAAEASPSQSAEASPSQSAAASPSQSQFGENDAAAAAAASSASLDGDLLAALQQLALGVGNAARGELQGISNRVDHVHKLNAKTALEYDEFADFASGLLVFAERLKHKNDGLNEQLRKIDELEEQVCELEAMVSTLDRYTSDLASKAKPLLHPPSSPDR